jgi:hypothetical protein
VVVLLHWCCCTGAAALVLHGGHYATTPIKQSAGSFHSSSSIQLSKFTSDVCTASYRCWCQCWCCWRLFGSKERSHLCLP